jgi:hypothetical protein
VAVLAWASGLLRSGKDLGEFRLQVIHALIIDWKLKNVRFEVHCIRVVELTLGLGSAN